MRTVPLALRLEKNKLISTAPWLLLLAITLPDASVIRLAKNTDDVTFLGNVYTAFAFELGTIGSGGDGQIQGVSLKVANPERALQPLMEANNGFVGCTVSLMVVHAANLSEDYTELTLAYDVLGAVCAEDWIEFTLGALNPIRRIFPLLSAKPYSCDWKFKGVECAYAEATATTNGGSYAAGATTITLASGGSGALRVGDSIYLQADPTKYMVTSAGTGGANLATGGTIVISPGSTYAFSGAKTVTGLASGCSRTLASCQALRNSARFGGRPGISGAARFVA